MEKASKEMRGIINAIEVWAKKHNNDVSFVCDFTAFEGKNCDVVDDRIMAFGSKKIIVIALDGLKKEIKKEKGEFVNW